jgi:peptide/nickel transport system permease protein
MLEQSRSGDANTEISSVLASTPETEDEAKYELHRTKRLGIGGWMAALWLIFIVLYAFIVPLFSKNLHHGDIANQGFLKDLGNPLGGDSIGESLTIELAEATRNSLLVGIGAVGIGLIVGGSLGLIAGYLRGGIDKVLSTVFNIFLAIPQLILAVAIVAALASNHLDKFSQTVPPSWERRFVCLIVALGLVSIPILGRITRANSLQWSQREFVLAARAQGANKFRVMVREVLPNVMPAMFSIALLGVAVAIVAEGALSLLGAGVAEGKSLGGIIALGQSDMRNNPHIVFEPVAIIFFTVLSLNYLGDIIRARFDVRESVL